MSKDQIIAKKSAEIAILKDELAFLRKIVYNASRNEKHKPTTEYADQPTLFDQEQIQEATVSQEQVETITYDRVKGKKVHPGRNDFPAHLPVEEVIVEPQENTEGLQQIGEEVTESLKYTPASLVILRTIRPKYAKANKEGVLIAPMVHRPIHKGIAEASLLSYLLISKFIDHLPFYRLIQGFKRDYKWKVSSSTVNDWFIACCTLLEPLYDKMLEQCRTGDYLQVDESPIKVLESEKKKQTHHGYMWVMHSPVHKIVNFCYHKKRGLAGAQHLIGEFKGYLQCDGYKVYDKFGVKPGITLVGCLVHARRYFHKAVDTDKKRANYALNIFSKIYKLEKENKNVQGYRKHNIAPLLNELKSWCQEQSLVVSPASRMGKAITYFNNQYTKLSKVLLDEKLELDNNLIENKIRPLALGRKNYLFAGNHKAAQRNAIMYSFFATCRMNKINEREWLENTLNTLANPEFTDYQSLLPISRDT